MLISYGEMLQAIAKVSTLSEDEQDTLADAMLRAFDTPTDGATGAFKLLIDAASKVEEN